MKRIMGARKRYLVWHFLSGMTNSVFVAEFPKSGATWLCQLLSGLTELPFPQKVPPTILSPCIVHGHYNYTRSMKRPIYLMRDGRDVMVSAYFHFLVSSNTKPSPAVLKWQKKFNFQDVYDVENNLSRFISSFFQDYHIGGQKSNWVSHYSSYKDKKNVLFIKYEDLLSKTNQELSTALSHLGLPPASEAKMKEVIHTFDFKNITGRAQGEEVATSFLRKGIHGDWKNKFSTESCQIFDALAGDQLIALGYEPDHNWY